MRTPRFTPRALVPTTVLGLFSLFAIAGLLFTALPAAAQSSPPAPSRPQADGGNAQVTITWSSNGDGGSAITGWEYTQRSYGGFLSGTWTPYGPWTPIPGSGPSTTSHTVTDLTNGSEYSFKVRAVNSAGKGADSPASSWVSPQRPALSATGVGQTSLALHLHGYHADWWYKGSQQGASCSDEDTDYLVFLRDLTPGTTYTYKAYSKEGCNSADLIDSLEFVTKPVPSAVMLTESLSHRTQTGVTLTIAGHTGEWWYRNRLVWDLNPFLGPCTAVSGTTLRLTGLKGMKGYEISAFTESTCTTAVASAGATTLGLRAISVKPTWARLMLFNTGGYRKWWYKGDLDAAECTEALGQRDIAGLTPETTYTYRAYDKSGCASSDEIGSVTFKTPATGTATLTVSDITATTATLTIAKHTGDWWFKGNWHSCTAVSSGTKSVDLTGLKAGVWHHYRAYEKAGCHGAEVVAVERWNALKLVPTEITATTATLRIRGHAGAWWHANQNGGTCSPVAAGKTEVDLANLTSGTSYNWNAYGKSGCGSADVIASATFTMGVLPATPSSVTVTRANGSLTASWPAVDGATSYHVTYTADGGANWSLAALKHPTASITIADVTNSANYIVAVRARNAYGDSGWRNSPTANPFVPPAPPGVPSSVTITRADGSLTASWPAVDGATSYHVTYTADGGANWSLAALNHPTASITIDSVTNSATYIVAVRARSAHGDSGWRNSSPAGPYTPPAPPGTPSSVTITRSDGSLTATWPAVDGATSYHVTYSSDGGASWSLAALNHPTASITIDSVTNSATYIVAVRARSVHGDSGWRNSPTANPFVPPPPGVPSSVTVTRSDGSLTASWPAVDGATSYHVRYSSDGGASWSLAALNHAAASITISGVTNSATYIVAVRARNAHGDSGWRDSPPADPFAPAAPPTVPSGLTATAGDRSVTLAWDDPSDASITGYEIQMRWTGVGWGAWTPIANSDSSTTSHIVIDLTNGTEYRFHLRAVNAAGTSGIAPNASPWYVAATPVPAAPPAVPSGLTATAGDRSVTLAWDDPSDAGITGYEIQMRWTGVGWGAWTLIANSDSSMTSHIVTDLTNGTEYRFHLRAVNAAGTSGTAPNASPWYVAATPVPSVSAMSLVQDPYGRLSNLSTLPSNRHGEAVVVPLVLSTSDPYKRQGLVRIVNHSERAGTVHVEAFDDSNGAYRPLVLAIGSHGAVLLSSADLERGNADKGLIGSTGPALAGDWRLLLTSELDIQAQSYVRHADGFLSSVHDMAPERDGIHRVATFDLAALNRNKDGGQTSLLRLVNLGAMKARAMIVGTDDSGALLGSGVELEVPAGNSLTLTARELSQGGTGLSGALGTGRGPWRLQVASEQPIRVMSLVQSPSGHLANHSTAPANRDGAAVLVPLLLSASDAHGRQGLLRIVNRSGRAGTVRIEAFDDSDWSYEQLALTIASGAAVNLSSDDLELGNAFKGLAGSTGPARAGDWRLRLESGLDLRATAYIRHPDGLVTSMHDMVPNRGGIHQMPVFGRDPGERSLSLLRLASVGPSPAQVTLIGIGAGDDLLGSGVVVDVPDGRSLTLMPGMLQGNPAVQQGGHEAPQSHR